MKVAYFPLRSSVELFRDPASPEPVFRAKYAAVLYEEVCFEIGLYEQKIGSSGSFQVRIAPPVDEERRRMARAVHESAHGFQISIGIESEPGVPAPPEAMQPVLTSDLEVSYAAEWHTGVLDELVPLEPDWVRWLDSNDPRLDEPGIKEPAAALKRSLEGAADVANPFHASFVADALSLDATVAAAMGASVQVTSLFEPLLRRLDGTRDHPGTMALAVSVPGIEELSWEQICEFREHPGSEEARAKLRAAEERVAAEDPSDAASFALRVGQEITADLFAAMSEMKGSLPKKLAKEGVNAGISLLPVVGSFASVVSAGEVIAETVKSERTWHAALMTLRCAAEDRARPPS